MTFFWSQETANDFSGATYYVMVRSRVNNLRHDQAFLNYSDIPKHLKGRGEWSWEGRRVKKDAVPEAVWRGWLEGTGQVEKHFFDIQATEPYRQPFANAYRVFARLFCYPAFRGDYIYRYDGKDEGGWPHSFKPLTLSRIHQHVLGKRIIGTIGYRFTNHITFDVDYHATDTRRELFLARCNILHEELPKFFSMAFFASCKPENIGGIHFTVLVNNIRISKAQQLAADFLKLLDKKYPKLAEIESFTKIEVYPVEKGNGDGRGCRLPLSKGRICITDRLLADDPKSNCINLVNWLKDRERRNIDPDAFLSFLANNAPEHEEPPARMQRPKALRAKEKHGMGSVGKMKNRCLRTLFDFWTGKTLPEDDTITKYSTMTARLIWKQGLLSEQECLAWLEDAFLSLPDASFSDRLSGANGGFTELMRVTRYMVDAVYRENGYQADPEASASKLQKVIDYCRRKGILIHDRSTWTRMPASFEQQEQAIINFNIRQQRLLKEVVHPVLHTDDLPATFEAARRILDFVKTNPDRELAWKLVPLLCADLDIAWHKNKCCAFLRALVSTGFLVVLSEKVWRGNGHPGNKARSYGIGEAAEDCYTEDHNELSVICSIVSIISTSLFTDKRISLVQRRSTKALRQ